MFYFTSPVPEDAEAIAFLHADLILAASEQASSERKEWAKKRYDFRRSDENIAALQTELQQALCVPDTQFWHVAKKADGTLCGFISTHKTEAISTLDMLYVDAHYHGKGIAQQLMGVCLVWNGIDAPMCVTVQTDNARGQAFYRKYDFAEQKESLHYFDNILPLISMIRCAQYSELPAGY